MWRRRHRPRPPRRRPRPTASGASAWWGSARRSPNKCCDQFPRFHSSRNSPSSMAAREEGKASGRTMTPLPYFIAAVVKAVRAYPLMNSSWDESRDEIIVKQPVNVGIAVNTSQGLLVPVLRDAEQLELTAIAEKSAQLIEGARAGTLPPNQMSGGTITVTNVGASGPVETGTPIINPPECCVVAFGAIKPRPMVVQGQVVARSGAWISISVDHRIVDGALATEFLTALVSELESISA